MKSVRAVIGAGIAILMIVLLAVFRGQILGGFRLLSTSAGDAAAARLTIENQELKAALARAVSEPAAANSEYLPVMLYSRYPFNDRDRITIDRGGDEGLVVGTPVFAARTILLGAVREVSRTRAVAETIFDPGWRSSVVVGTHRVKAVLSGGSPLRLELIPQDSIIAAGDIVMSVDPAFPMGSIIGAVLAVEPTMQNAWRSATVGVAYRIDELETVFVPSVFP